MEASQLDMIEFVQLCMISQLTAGPLAIVIRTISDLTRIHLPNEMHEGDLGNSGHLFGSLISK